MDSVTNGLEEETSPVEPLGAAFSVDAGQVRAHLDQIVRESAEQTLNSLLDTEWR